MYAKCILFYSCFNKIFTIVSYLAYDHFHHQTAYDFRLVINMQFFPKALNTLPNL